MYVIFAKPRAVSAEVTNPIFVPVFFLCPPPLQWSQPYLSPSQMLLMPGRWASRALAPGELCPRGKYRPRPARPSSGLDPTEVPLLSAGDSNEPCGKYLPLRCLSFQFRWNWPVLSKGRWRLAGVAWLRAPCFPVQTGSYSVLTTICGHALRWQ